jgi:hypothetical protein
MWITVLMITIVALVIAIMGVLFYGANRWRSETKKLHMSIQAAQLPLTLKLYDPRQLDGLPAPVQRFFRTVLEEGQPLVIAVNVEHTGTFNLSQTGEQWKPFKSTQRVITHHPGFVWDARIHMAPWMTVHVHDAYVAGEGVLTGKLLGFIKVMEQPNTPELSQGELMRFFAEGAWYPTALLPGQGVVWEPLDDAQASAVLTDGTTNVRLAFQFDDQGLISAVRSDGRYREVDGKLEATPWEGRFWDYQLRDGMLVPLQGEVGWLLQEGWKPYWRGQIHRIEYELAQ